MDKKKLTPEQQFFNDKTLEFAEELYNQNEDKIKEAYKGQIKNRDDLLSKIAKILLTYNISDSIIKLNAADKKKLYTELSDSIVTNIKSELDFENSLTKEILTSVGKEKYNVNNYVYSLGADFNLTQLGDEVLEKIINTKIKDKLWSDRLYDNKNDMCKVLQKEVEKFLKGETNVNQIEEKIKDKYNTNAHETNRLVQDNICRVQEGANDVWQHEHDIKYVMYMATLDGKVCANCAQYDGKPFELDKKPVQIPQHPFCRCCYTSIPNADWRPKMRLDNETKKNINWQSYQEWHKNYIENNPERLTNHKMIKNKSSDKKVYEKYKEILGKEMPKTLEEFPKLKYNNINEWEDLKGYYSYKNNNPLSNRVYYIINKDIKELIDKGIVSDTIGTAVKPIKVEFENIHKHASKRMQKRNITDEDAKEYINNSKIMFKQNSGRKNVYYSKEGVATVVPDEKLLVTVFSKDDYDEGAKAIMEVLKKHGV